jgi:hypothetical protein
MSWILPPGARTTKDVGFPHATRPRPSPDAVTLDASVTENVNGLPGKHDKRERLAIGKYIEMVKFIS